MKVKICVIVLIVTANSYCLSPTNEELENEKTPETFVEWFNTVLERFGILSEDINEVQETVRKTEKIVEEKDVKDHHKFQNALISDDVEFDELYSCNFTTTSAAGRIYGKFANQSEPYHRAQYHCAWILHSPYSVMTLTLKRNDTKRGKSLTFCNVTAVSLNSSDFLKGVAKLGETMRLHVDNAVIATGTFIILECILTFQRKQLMDYVQFQSFGPIQSSNDMRIYSEFAGTDSGSVSIYLNETDYLTQYKIGVISWGYHTTFKHYQLAAIARNLEAHVEKEFCSFSFLSLHYGNDVFDCCKINCSEYKFILNDKNTRLIYGINTLHPNSKSLFAKATWDERRYGYQDEKLKSRRPWRECGGVVSGWTSGKIIINRESYTRNARCVWTIHPFPSSEILLSIGQVSIETGHDFLTAVEIGEDGSVRTTDLAEIPLSMLKLRGRLILITLVADRSDEGNGFSLSWEAVETRNMSLLKEDDRLERYHHLPGYYGENRGESEANISLESFERPGQNFFIIDPFFQRPNSLNLNISYEVIGNARLEVLSSRNGIFEQLLSTGKAGTLLSQNFTSWDAIFIIIANIPDSTGKVRFNASWGIGDLIEPESVWQCGQAITLEKEAMIEYFSPQYEQITNDRCTFIIHSKYEKVSFKMIKAKFSEKSAKSVTIESVDLATARINHNFTTFLRNASSTAIMPGPLILVTFASDKRVPNSDGVRVFTRVKFQLHLEGLGPVNVSIDSKAKGDEYSLINKWIKDQVFSYPRKGEGLEKLIVVYNRAQNDTPAHTDLAIKFYGELTSELDEGYEYELVIFSYTNDASNTSSAFEPSVICTFKTGVVQDECVFNKGAITNRQETNANEVYALDSRSFEIIVPHVGFLAMVTPLSNLRKVSNSSVFTMFWGNDLNCGGIISEENGTITHHIDSFSDPRFNKEPCVWEINVTKSNKTSIRLKNSNPDAVISIIPVDPSTGKLALEQSIKFNSTYEVLSPIAIVTYIPESYEPFNLNFKAGGGGPNVSFTKLTALQGVESKFLRGGYAGFGLTKSKMRTMGKDQGFILVVNPVMSFYSNMTVNVTDLQLFLGANCSSDSLSFFGWSGNLDYELVKSFSAVRDEDCEKTCLENERNISGNMTIVKAMASISLLLDSRIENASSGNSLPSSCDSDCSQESVKLSFTNDELKFTIRVPFIVVYNSVSKAKFKGKLGFTWKSDGSKFLGNLLKG